MLESLSKRTLWSALMTIAINSPTRRIVAVVVGLFTLLAIRDAGADKCYLTAYGPPCGKVGTGLMTYDCGDGSCPSLVYSAGQVTSCANSGIGRRDCVTGPACVARVDVYACIGLPSVCTLVRSDTISMVPTEVAGGLICHPKLTGEFDPTASEQP